MAEAPAGVQVPMKTGEEVAEELAALEAGMASSTGIKLFPRQMAALSAVMRVTTGRVAPVVLAVEAKATLVDAATVDEAVEEEEAVVLVVVEAAFTGL